MTDHRYTTPYVDALWSRQAQINGWCQIEQALLAVLEPDLTPPAVEVTEYAVATREQETGHEVGAFLELYESALESPRHRRWLHYGLTSSDLVDTQRQMALYRSTRAIARSAFQLRSAVLRLPEVEVTGRTHGQPASPSSYRHRWDVAMVNATDLQHSPGLAPVAKLSGAVGRFRVLDRGNATQVAQRLGCLLAPDATQVLPAFHLMRHLRLWLGVVQTVEQIALDARLGAMLGEVVFASQKVGSTAMPGKVNPIKAEQLCGVAKLWRGLYASVLDSRALWLDRDLHHSSVDRVALGQLAGMAHYLVTECTLMLDSIRLQPSRELPPIGSVAARDADALLGLATQAFVAPRSVIYDRLTQLLRSDPWLTTGHVIEKMATWSDLGKGFSWTSADELTRRYVVCYSVNQ